MEKLSALSPEQRTLLFVTTPALWPHWPLLPVVRRRNDEDMELGIVYDARGASDTCGYSCTVFMTNLFLVPETEKEILALPKEVFDSPEELWAAGWAVD